MVFKPGQPKPPNSGRKPGVQNNIERIVLSNYIGKLLLNTADGWETALTELRTRNPALYLNFIMQLLRLTVPTGGMSHFCYGPPPEPDDAAKDPPDPPKALPPPACAMVDPHIAALLQKGITPAPPTGRTAPDRDRK